MSNEKRAIRSRLDFSKIPTATQIPNLIEVQRRSYERFLQMDKLPNERDDSGLQSVFVSVFPITDFRGISQLDFVDFSIGNTDLVELVVCIEIQLDQRRHQKYRGYQSEPSFKSCVSAVEGGAPSSRVPESQARMGKRTLTL